MYIFSGARQESQEQTQKMNFASTMINIIIPKRLSKRQLKSESSREQKKSYIQPNKPIFSFDFK